MKKVSFFIDGFNLYHALNDYSFKGQYIYRKYKWLNLYELAKIYLNDDEIIEKIFYFSSFAKWDNAKLNRHKQYINALKTTNKVEFIEGNFKKRHIKCQKCGFIIFKPEEKQTDVNIALYLLKMAFKKEFDIAILLTADSDLIPLINTIKEIRDIYNELNHIKIGILPPIKRENQCKDLIKLCDFNKTMKENHLKNSQFPYSLIDLNGNKLQKPSSWI